MASRQWAEQPCRPKALIALRLLRLAELKRKSGGRGEKTKRRGGCKRIPSPAALCGIGQKRVTGGVLVETKVREEKEKKQQRGGGKRRWMAEKQGKVQWILEKRTQTRGGRESCSVGGKVGGGKASRGGPIRKGARQKKRGPSTHGLGRGRASKGQSVEQVSVGSGGGGGGRCREFFFENVMGPCKNSVWERRRMMGEGGGENVSERGGAEWVGKKGGVRKKCVTRVTFRTIGGFKKS